MLVKMESAGSGGGGVTEIDLTNNTHNSATLSAGAGVWVNTNVAVSGVSYICIELKNRLDYCTIAAVENGEITCKVKNWSDIKVENGYFWFYQNQASGTQPFNIEYYT